MKRNIKESKGLSDYQKNIVVEMVKADFECGHPTTGEDMRSYFEEDEDLKDNVDAAVDYYVELVQMGPGGFYEEYPDLDWDEDFVAEYGDLDEFEESSEDKKILKMKKKTGSERRSRLVRVQSIQKFR